MSRHAHRDHIRLHRRTDWRRELFDGYKAARRVRDPGKTDTGEYVALAGGTWARDGWPTLLACGFEGDDIIATIVHRLAQAKRLGAGVDVVILSGDSDLQALVTDPAVAVLRPMTGGAFELMRVGEVWAKHGVASPAQLPDLKALAGDPGDSIRGPYGKKCEATARKLLEQHGTLAGVLQHEKTMTPERRLVAELAFRLVQLRTDVPVPALTPKIVRAPSGHEDRSMSTAELLNQTPRPGGRHGQLAEIAELEVREGIPLLREVEEPTSDLQRGAVTYEPAPALDLARDLSTLDDARERRGGLDEPYLPLSTLRVSDDTDCHRREATRRLTASASAEVPRG